MGGIGDWADRARKLAEEHPDQVDRAADRAEEFADERTGHKYDEQIERGVDEVQRRLGAGRDARPAAGPGTEGAGTEDGR
ncbi:antitoxin [Streptacidiphilus sp. ASG 303]|uniref:antitoxin n=1 Tax=Streptacidiphilus sp. ASG 303 TaxID=2896847 RepID=UPI001E5245E2|nr:antitoxin [Streptacidiphilus sp. ASG 303]MCD0481760.1 antitoxin [Streptacidiphilus sp. ASG 303]